MSVKGPRLRLWLVAWPLILSNLTQPLLGLVDTALLGHLPDARYIGATAVGASLLALVFWGFGFLRMGTTGLVARAYGGGLTDRADDITRKSLKLAIAIALSLWLLAPWCLPQAISWMDSSPEVAALALDYSLIRLVAAPATLCSYVLLGWFIARQNSQIPLMIAVLTQGLNIVLDLVFILVLDLRSDGAALASALSEYLGLAAFVYCFSRKNPHFSLFLSSNSASYRELMAINSDLMIRTWCLLASFLFFTSQGARQGDLILAANAILLQWVHLVSYGLDGLAHATESLVGEAKGGENGREQQQLLRWAGQDSLAIALLLSALLWFAQTPVVDLFTSIQAVKDEVYQHLVWVLLLPPLSVAAYVLDGFAIGVGNSRAMRDSMLISCFLVFIPCWYLSQQWGNHGLWLSLCLFNLARGISLAWFSLPESGYQFRRS